MQENHLITRKTQHKVPVANKCFNSIQLTISNDHQ